MLIKNIEMRIDTDIALKAQKGFTLLEMVIVIVIISIISIVSVFYAQTASFSLYDEAQQIANNIRYAQSLAMTSGQRYSWVKTSATSYQIQNSSGTAILLSGGSTTANFLAGVSFGTLANLPNNLISFDGRGTPYTTAGSPGTPLASNASIALSASGMTSTITIVAGTGAVSVQ